MVEQITIDFKVGDLIKIDFNKSPIEVIRIGKFTVTAKGKNGGKWGIVQNIHSGRYYATNGRKSCEVFPMKREV